MRFKVDACDLGLSRHHGTCAIDTKAEAKPSAPLSMGLRTARAAAGLGFLLAALPLARPRPLRPLCAVAAWFGIAHLVAAATAYRGCPELGAIPSLLLRREIATECGPWEWIDERLKAGRRPQRR
jgi:hypothetical protein